MREILITSSVLILALLALRGLFRKTISRRTQYALWGLVLLRLLVPLNLPAAEHSVLTAAEPVMRNLDKQAIYVEPVRETVTGPEEDSMAAAPAAYQRFAVGAASQDNTHTFTDQNQVRHEVEYRRQIGLTGLLRAVWYGGMVLTGVWFLLSNLCFWQKLRNRRITYRADGCPYRVYLVEYGLPSPCLFGLLRPAVYLTPKAAASPESLRHVLAHETTHARHGDLLWSLLRCVCLTVYWFDPLVWIAAAASKTDCELACDEGALRQLEEGERLAYGRTLLSLIPVRRTRGNPLLSATTMAVGKRQLKDRITRIAENRKNRMAALLAVLVLAAAASAVTFTGAASIPERAARADGPLSGEELRYFNETFFNHPEGGFNIHNQFLSSTYESPRDIDLFELFYCGTGLPGGVGEEERQAVAALEGEADTDLTKCSAADMDRTLRENTGLGLEETNRTGLDSFTYLEQYNAYYHFHGDTNYRMEVRITAGERKNGFLYLYYEDTFMAGGWKRITLREPEEGGYWFVSHMPCQRPAIPTVYPAGEPVLVIPLTDLSPYEPQVMPVEIHTGDCAKRGGEMLVGEGDGRIHFRSYLSTDGSLYASIPYHDVAGQETAWEAGVFFTFPEGNSIEWGESTVSGSYTGTLFDHEVMELSYTGAADEYTRTSLFDYYYFEDDRTPVRLAQVSGAPATRLDLDGDGTDELISAGGDGAQLFFRRNGQLYAADIKELLAGAWPEMNWWDYSILDADSRCVQVAGFVSVPEWGENALASFTRWIYFDGENLRVYADLQETVDHAAVNISASPSEEVRRDALAAARASYEEFLSYSGGWQESDARDIYDDWRLSSLSLVNTYGEFPIGTVEVYRYSWQAHAARPTEVTLAGGMYLREDGWMGGANAGTGPYLVYRVRENGKRQRLENRMTWDYSEDSIAYRADLCRTILDSGLVTPEAFSGQDHYVMFAMDSVGYLNQTAEFSDGEQTLAFERLAAYAGSEAPLTEEGELFSENFPDTLQGNPNLTEGGAQALLLLRNALAGGAPEQGYAGAWAQQVMAEIVDGGDRISMELNTAGVTRGGGRYDTDPALGNGPNRVYGFGDFVWSWAEEDHPAGASLTLASQDGTRAFTFWQDSELVRCDRLDQTLWLRAEEPDPEDVFADGIFAFMRIWYDEAEADALEGEIVIPDRGQSRLEIAQAWAERFTGVGLLVTPGSKAACTYVEVTAEVDRWADMPEEIYPEWTVGKERFYFGYTRVFVPENEQAQRWNMAGNTGGYTGSDPNVPEGAWEDWKIGCMYRLEDGWHCDEVGTGP